MANDLHSKLTVQIGFYVSLNSSLRFPIWNAQPRLVQLFQPWDVGPEHHKQTIEDEFELGVFDLRHETFAGDLFREVMTERSKQTQNARIFVQSWHLKIPQGASFRATLKKLVSYFIVMILKREKIIR